MAFLIILCTSLLHPFHVSVSTVYYKPDKQVVQVEQSIFLDDLELALQSFAGKTKMDITEMDDEELTSLLRKYLSDRFRIVSQGKTLPLKFLGNEMDLNDNVMWCYWEASSVTSFDNFKVQNTLLLEAFDDQENIIHYKKNGKTNSERTYRNSEWANF